MCINLPLSDYGWLREPHWILYNDFSEEPLAFLRSQPQFQQMRQMIQQNPALLQAFIEQIRVSNPRLLQVTTMYFSGGTGSALLVSWLCDWLSVLVHYKFLDYVTVRCTCTISCLILMTRTVWSISLFLLKKNSCFHTNKKLSVVYLMLILFTSIIICQLYK